jgi:hypothetical protein
MSGLTDHTVFPAGTDSTYRTNNPVNTTSNATGTDANAALENAKTTLVNSEVRYFQT